MVSLFVLSISENKIVIHHNLLELFVEFFKLKAYINHIFYKFRSNTSGGAIGTYTTFDPWKHRLRLYRAQKLEIPLKVIT